MRQKVKLNITIHDMGSEGVHAFAPAFIAGLPLWMLIDTGASKSIFDLEFVKTKLSYVPLEPSPEAAHGFNHNTTIQIAQLPDIYFNGIPLDNPAVHVLDLSYINGLYTSLGYPAIQGIIGSDWLKRCKAVLDFGENTLKLRIPIKEEQEASDTTGEDIFITIPYPEE